MVDKKTTKKASIDTKNFNWKSLITFIILFVFGVGTGAGVDMVVRQGDDGGIIIEASTIELSEEQVDAIIETENGEEVIEVPTVEIIDNAEIFEDDTQGLGAYFDTESAMSFYNSVGLKQCLNNAFGAQCFELANQFWWNYAGRGLNSCGTGAAKGVFKCDNAGQDFIIIDHAEDIQAGDWVVFGGGQYGHIGQALGRYNNGYVALFGQNQGGAYCEKGGSATNVINKSTKDFIGAFRPVTYIIPEPEPEPVEEPASPNTGAFTKEQ